ncbi:MAG: hypothetical protein IPP19_12355 [Verrucomicrobia bacterium]|nr:hypothetical protein [Verrucomicrobiota bacterium]
MRSHFRCIWLGIVFLAVVAAVTSCKKQKETVPEKAAEPWPVAAVWAWGDAIAHQDNSAPSLVVYSDGRLILKKVVGDPWSLPRKPPTVKYLTKYLTAEELADFEESVLAVVKGTAHG